MVNLCFLDDGNFLARWPELIFKGLKRLGVETSNDQMYNDQYFEIKKKTNVESYERSNYSIFLLTKLFFHFF